MTEFILKSPIVLNCIYHINFVILGLDSESLSGA